MEKIYQYILKEIETLCKIPSPSGYTHNVTEYLFKALEDMGYKTELTNKGSILCELGGKGDPIVLAAHVDTLGAMVRSIKSNGRLAYTKIGSYTANSIELENCTIHTRSGKEYSGTFQLTTPAVHVYPNTDDTKRSEKNVEVIIDEVVHNAKDVKKLGIRNGDFISFDPRTIITESGFVKSRHLDDKASSGILMGIAKYLSDNKTELNRKVYLYFSAYEEVGHGAASGLPEDIKSMIAVDMGAVGDDLDTDEYCVSICTKDSSGPYDYSLTTELINLAEENKLKYATDIYPYYGSDASAAIRAGYNVKHALIGPGIFASHGYERTHKDALENTFLLLKKYLRI